MERTSCGLKSKESVMATQLEVDSDTLRWPTATTQVNVEDAQELEFWARRLRVSREMLKRAVWKVGQRYLDVERYLFQKRSAFTQG
jgi:hypothetical protein